MAGRILLVEDDPDLGTTLQLFLQLNGFVVQVARDAESALRSLETTRFDVLITDEQLPGISGQVLAARVAGWGGGPPIVAFTGSDDTETLENSGDFAAVLRKPCEPEVLVVLVKQLLAPRAP